MLKSSSSKAQFFVLGAFSMVTFLFFLSQWLKPTLILDPSSIILRDEVFLFNNLKQKSLQVIEQAKTCRELRYNLQEYGNFIERVVAAKGKLLFYYELVTPCELPGGEDIPALVKLNLTLSAPNLFLSSEFYETWQPP